MELIKGEQQSPSSWFFFSPLDFDSLEEVCVICEEDNRKSHGMIVSETSWNLHNIESVGGDAEYGPWILKMNLRRK